MAQGRKLDNAARVRVELFAVCTSLHRAHMAQLERFTFALRHDCPSPSASEICRVAPRWRSGSDGRPASGLAPILAGPAGEAFSTKECHTWSLVVYCR